MLRTTRLRKRTSSRLTQPSCSSFFGVPSARRVMRRTTAGLSACSRQPNNEPRSIAILSFSSSISAHISATIISFSISRPTRSFAEAPRLSRAGPDRGYTRLRRWWGDAASADSHAGGGAGLERSLVNRHDGSITSCAARRSSRDAAQRRASTSPEHEASKRRNRSPLRPELARR